MRPSSRSTETTICVLLTVILLFSTIPQGNAQDVTVSVKDKKALVLVPASRESGHSFDDIEKSLRDQGGYQVTKITGTEVKPEHFKELHNYAVNFINTHGDYWNDRSGEQWCRLTTFKYFTLSYYRDNYDDFGNGRLIRNWRGIAHEKPFVAVTQRYISEYNQSYPNSLLYAFSCNQMKNQALSGALSKPGFMALIGFSRYSEFTTRLGHLAGVPLTTDEQSALDFFSTATVTNKPVREAYNEIKGKTKPGLELKEYYGNNDRYYLNAQEGKLPEIPDVSDREECIKVMVEAEEAYWQKEYARGIETKKVEYEIVLQEYDGYNAKAIVLYKDMRPSSMYVVEKKDGKWIVTDNYSTAD